MMGEPITTLENGLKPAGSYSLTWHTDNLPSGVYICVLENTSDSARYRIMIIKE
jgi:hypothetical protein